jgi:hypothetical protein
MNNKQEFGQFMTTNYEYILQDMTIPKNIKTIIEPFAGNCDLLKFIRNYEQYHITCYDIDSKYDNVIQRDTLLNPPNMENMFVLTNPPYLSRNKSKNKKIFDKYQENDLYKCFIRILINTRVIGGIIIIPLNFFSSIRKMDINLRKDFLQVYDIIKLNIFEETVFSDTTYTTCAIQFHISDQIKNNGDIIESIIYPSKKQFVFELNTNNNYTIGGEIYQLKQSDYKITRLTKNNVNKIGITNILVKCIDDNINSKIRTNIVSNKNRYIDDTKNSSDRSYATLVINPEISLNKQILLVEQFNDFLEDYRTKYNSMFLSNYRESNSIARKRSSFKLIYTIINHLLCD